MPERLEIVIDARDNASGVIRGVATGVRGSFGSMSQSIQANAGQIRMAGMAVTAFGVGVVASAGKCVAALGVQERAQAKLSSAIEGTAQAIDQSRLEQLAAELQQVTTFGDEATIEMEAMLVTFGLNQEKIEQLVPRVQNLAAMLGTDLNQTAIMVGKAIVGNVGALQKYGIVIDEATLASGDFNGILQAIDANTGDAAKEVRAASHGIDGFKMAMGDTAESIAKGLVPAIETLAPLLQTGFEVMGKIAETPLGRTFVVAGVAVGALCALLGPLLIVLPSLAKGWDIVSAALVRNRVAADAAATANLRAAGMSTGAVGTTGLLGRVAGGRLAGMLGPVAGIAAGSAMHGYAAYGHATAAMRGEQGEGLQAFGSALSAVGGGGM
ncbi:MAG: hypothetical protein IMF16_04945, partial [Proteobacteria bacterium]|nr:hypothetical protein [Pseudomonadota bacterium]